MRHAVKKPTASHKLALRAYGPTSEPSEPVLGTVIVSKPAQSLDHKRLRKATSVAKSELINHFSSVTASDFATIPSIAAASATVPHGPITVLPLAVTGTHTKPTTSSELLEQALQQATSHQQAVFESPHRNRVKHRARVGTAIALPLVVLALVGLHNLPGIRLQMASASVGFSATLPNYRPVGFSQGALSYSPGVVATEFHSNSDDRAYTVTQKRSSWDKTALRDNFLNPLNTDYQSVAAGSKIIYIYGQHNATWVSDGIWYVIQSKGSLSDRQVVLLASSL